MSILIQGEFQDVSKEYADFVEKFKPKKTTDDCYTPDNIYNVILDWASEKYGFDKSKVIRPFWPGGDYQREKYTDGCVVVDNPPFSILSKIIRFYNANGIKYFLFGPSLTIFSAKGDANYVIAGASITYANGAVVPTSFVTNLGEYLIESAPDLRDAIKAEDDKNRKEKTRETPKYTYPSAVITAASIQYLSVHNTHYRLKSEDALFIRRLDAQCGTDKALFGGGFLLSERAAAERAAAERAAAERAAAERAAAERAAAERAAATVWALSDRERALQKMLGNASENQTKENT